MNYWILCSLLVLERYYSAGKHRLSLGCRAMSLQQRRQCLSSTWDGCGEICVFAHAFIAFLGYFWFWMGDIEVARWNGVDFLVPKHLRKSKIGLLEQIWAKNPYVTFFLGHPVVAQWHRVNAGKCVHCYQDILNCRCQLRRRFKVVRTMISSSIIHQKSSYQPYHRNRNCHCHWKSAQSNS